MLSSGLWRTLPLLLVALLTSPVQSADPDSAAELLQWLGVQQLVDAIPGNMELQVRSAAANRQLDQSTQARLLQSLRRAIPSARIAAEQRAVLGQQAHAESLRLARLVLQEEPLVALRKLEHFASEDTATGEFREYRERLAQRSPGASRQALMERLLAANHRVEFSLMAQLAVRRCRDRLLAESGHPQAVPPELTEQAEAQEATAIRAQLETLARQYYLFALRHQDSKRIEQYIARLQDGEVQWLYTLLQKSLAESLRCRID